MSNPRAIAGIAAALLALTNAAIASEAKPLSPVHATQFEFTTFLHNRPLELGLLLGKHFSDVVPGQKWDSFPSPEEYKNQSIRYGVFERPPLIKGWDFLGNNYCVSHYSMFILFFNRGFVFKVELRFVADTFAGVIKSNDPAFCGDETPIFTAIAKKLGGSSTQTHDEYVIKRYTNTYVETLSTGGGNTDWSWDLRGGPSLPNF